MNALGAAQSYLEEGPYVHIKADVGEPGSDDFGPSVVAVLAHLGNEDTRPAALTVHELVNSGGKHMFCQCKSLRILGSISTHKKKHLLQA